MKKLKKLLMNRWFLGAIGFVAIALLIWFVGEGIAVFDKHPLESAVTRLVVIGIGLLLWLGYELLRVYRGRRQNQKLLDSLAKSEAAEDVSAARSKEEIALLKTRFESAVATLKKARFKDAAGGEQYLYELPWYVFIGAPGSGKTTALVNSGLRFPLAEDGAAAAVRGVGGTRNCDWWFTDEAVFLDTAGRYTTQETDHAADAAAWTGFLDLLKRFRPRRPLNGAIVTLSVADLLSQTDAQRAQYAVAVRQRVQELYERLGVRFPIYLMVTKADLLAGFMEFFGDLGREERSQAWGMTFSYRQQAAEGTDFVQAFKAEFAELEKRLNARVIDRLQQERDMQRRALIYNFPQQFSLLGPLVDSFVDQTFRASRFDQQAMLRGVYFTSGTQEGSPIDRVLGTLARAFNLERRVMPPAAASGKSFFLTRLLREIAFPEAGLAGLNEKRELAVKWGVRAAYAAIAVVGVGLVAAWLISYNRNRELVADMNVKVEALAERVQKLPPPRADDIGQVLPLLKELRDLPFGYGERERTPALGMRFGLFQGERLGAQAREAYRGVLRDAFLPRVALRLEEQIRASQNSEVLYEALKGYLMLFDDKHLDPQFLEEWVFAVWGGLADRQGAEALRGELAGHLRASLERRPIALKFQRDDELVAATQRALAGASLPERVYARIKLLGADGSVAPFKISEAAGPAASQVLVRASGEPLSAPFPGLFTYDGYHKTFRPQVDKIADQMVAEEDWVLGPHAGSSRSRLFAQGQIVAEVRRRYLEEYLREWDKLLKDIQLKKSSGLSDTIAYARVLAAPDSPLKKLAVAAARETSLAPREALDKAAEKASGAIADATKKVVTKILGGAAPAVLPPVEKAPESLVDEHFARLRHVATPAAPNQPIPLDNVLNLLNDFYQELSAAETSMRGGGIAPPALPAAAKLKAEAEKLPPPLQGVLRALVVATSGQAAQAGEAKIKEAIKGAGSFCEKAVAKRYPFDRKSARDVTVEDFAAVFGPGGDLDEFFTKNLQQFVDTAGPVWRARPGSEGSISVPAGAIRQFQNADVIRKAFFKAGSRAPAATADLVLLSTDVGPVTLDYDGQQFKLAPGPNSAVRVAWPPQRPAPTAKLYLAPNGQVIAAEGTWALFRLFDRATADPGVAAERARLSYQIDGRAVAFELRAASVFNPFRLKELETFQCPGR